MGIVDAGLTEGNGCILDQAYPINRYGLAGGLVWRGAEKFLLISGGDAACRCLLHE